MQWKQVINCLICLFAALQTQQKPTGLKNNGADLSDQSAWITTGLLVWDHGKDFYTAIQTSPAVPEPFPGGTSKHLLSVLLWCWWLWWQIQAGWLGSRDREAALGLWFVVCLWSLLTTWTPGPNLWQNEESTMDLHVLVLRPSSHCNSRKYIIYAKANSRLISYSQSLDSHIRYFQNATLSKYLFHPEQCMCRFFSLLRFV